jgi:hypothetical protein
MVTLQVSAVVRQQQDDVQQVRAMILRKHEELKKRAGDLEALRKANVTSCDAAEQAIKAKVKLMIEAIQKQVELAQLDCVGSV